jgi:hypothetical protein
VSIHQDASIVHAELSFVLCPLNRCLHPTTNYL